MINYHSPQPGAAPGSRSGHGHHAVLRQRHGTFGACGAKRRAAAKLTPPGQPQSWGGVLR